MEKKNHKKLSLNTKTLYQFTTKKSYGSSSLPDTTVVTVTVSGIMAKVN